MLRTATIGSFSLRRHRWRVVMETFTLSFRWGLLIRMLGRNPLVRVSDRIEALLLALVFVTALLAVPVAGAIVTAVHDSRAQTLVEQARNRHLVAATAIEDAIQAPDAARGVNAAVQARWRVGAVDHTELVTARADVKAGDPVDIWVNAAGNRVAAPAPAWQAGTAALLTAAAYWLVMVGAAFLLWAGVHLVVVRSRTTGWDRALELLADGSGRTGPQM
ncbi:Rv1733c family protein [Mycolicibacterium mageritense]|uniref:Rv1733c family protein n=1 Tax=Mycolicibacterium mageritense TaxID=53462 RepID=UPI003C6E6469